MTPTDLHITQIRSSQIFAYRAMEGFCAPCKNSGMQIRLRELRERLGVNLEEMAERSGMSVSQISRWESGSNNIPSGQLPKLAAAYQCRVSDIFADDKGPLLPLGPTIYIKGEVAAGIWREAVERPQEEWEPFSGLPDLPFPIEQRFGLRVVGDSMNELYPDGSIVECLSVFSGVTIESGRRVVVLRRREDLEYEATVKEYVLDAGGRQWLVPRSTNPAHQRSIPLDENEPGIMETRIIAVVVASHRKELP